MDTIYIVKQYSKLRDNFGLHGAWIEGAAVGTGVVVIIGDSHDGYGVIVGPRLPQPGGLVQADGTYLNYKKVAHIELAHLGEVNEAEHEYRIITDASTGAIKSSVMVR